MTRREKALGTTDFTDYTDLNLPLIRLISSFMVHGFITRIVFANPAAVNLPINCHAPCLGIDNKLHVAATSGLKPR
jgi:hypothetical protein